MERKIPKDGNLRKKFIFFATKIIFILLINFNLSFAAFIPTIRVLVDRKIAEVNIEGYDLLLRSAETQSVFHRTSEKASYAMNCSLGGRINIRTKKNEILHHQGPLKIESLGGFLRVNQKQFRDDLYVYSFNGDCLLVNHVDLEKYVAGLLHSEMNASWNMNTLMAQAIAARTYAIYQMKEAGTTQYKNFKPPFDLNSSVKDQVYEGANLERYRAIKAVEATSGLVLTYQGEPIKAFYHSTCGGYTESVAKVWGRALPYMTQVKCGYCNKSPRYHWKYSVDQQILITKLAKIGLKLSDIQNIKVIKRNGLDRAQVVELKSGSENKKIQAIQMRDILGTLNIMSTDFTVSKVGNEIVFNGHGSGHGVGMCQWGAKAMGEHGKNYQEILKHYYPQVQITKFY